MRRFVFIAEFKREENGQYSYHFPVLPGCFGGGDSYFLAVEDARSCLKLWLQSMLESGERIPKNEPACEADVDQFGNILRRPIVAKL